MGDADAPPTLKFVSSEAKRVIDALDQQWGGNLVNQNNFYHHMRNFVIDMTSCWSCTGIHWQVAQATQLSNIFFKMALGSDSQGIWMENGSGGHISDLVFEGGLYGMWVGNQQFTSRNITIRDASVAAVYLNWDWGWTFQSLTVENCPVAVDLGTDAASLVLLDSSFINISVAGVRSHYDGITQYNDVLLDNLVFSSSITNIVVMNNGMAALTATSNSSMIASWVQGNVWLNDANQLTSMDLAAAGYAPTKPSALLASDGRFFQKGRPAFDSKMYMRSDAVLEYGVPNDGVTDATQSLQAALYAAAADNTVLFLPYGHYLITDTVYVPPGSRVLGEAWSVLVAGGDPETGKFADAANPVPLLRVGRDGEVGTVQLVDLLLTSEGPQVGSVLVEWNIAGTSAGDAGMWEVHFRIGGAVGTNINPSTCPRGDGSSATEEACSGVHTLLHITSSGSGYFENIWGWVADHDLDYDDQINVYSARGLLCESRGPVWLYGTAFEHNVLYQYNFASAQNVFMGMIQTETPYFQPSANTPFSSIPRIASDPEYCTGDARCDMALAMSVRSSSDVFLYGGGLYSFFSCWDQTCLSESPDCQLELVRIDNESSVHLFGLNTYGSVFMLAQTEDYAKASDNSNTFCSTAAADLMHSL